jgi:S-adenosylmethionine hydrolase
VTGIITLLTDFGQRDSYVAEMKGVLLSAVPAANVVDVTHDIPPGNIFAAQYVLSRTWHRFPPGTVHLAIVDPTVGTKRRVIAAASREHHFVAPDNGLLTPVLTGARVVEIPVPPRASSTFHGRDVLAPIAALLVGNVPLERIGREIRNPICTPLPGVRRDGQGAVGCVIYVDRFGTLVTNLVGPERPEPGASDAGDAGKAGRAEKAGKAEKAERTEETESMEQAAALGTSAVVIAGQVIPLRRTFADVASGELVAFTGSGGTIEVAVREGSAAERLGVKVGAEVRMKQIAE